MWLLTSRRAALPTCAEPACPAARAGTRVWYQGMVPGNGTRDGTGCLPGELGLCSQSCTSPQTDPSTGSVCIILHTWVKRTHELQQHVRAPAALPGWHCRHVLCPYSCTSQNLVPTQGWPSSRSPARAATTCRTPSAQEPGSRSLCSVLSAQVCVSKYMFCAVFHRLNTGHL